MKHFMLFIEYFKYKLLPSVSLNLCTFCWLPNLRCLWCLFPFMFIYLYVSIEMYNTYHCKQCTPYVVKSHWFSLNSYFCQTNFVYETWHSIVQYVRYGERNRVIYNTYHIFISYNHIFAIICCCFRTIMSLKVFRLVCLIWTNKIS